MIKIELLDKVFQYDSSEQGGEDIMRSIGEAASDTDMMIDSMDIDGTKIYSDYYKYIKKNIVNIEYIRVNLITKAELITSILHTTYSYIQGAMPKLQSIIDSFYTGEKNAAVIDDLASLTEGITWIYSVNMEIIAMNYENEYLKATLSMGYGEDIQRLDEAFNELKNAIINMDYILIADILNYEILEIFKTIITVLQDAEKTKNSSAGCRKNKSRLSEAIIGIKGKS